MNTPTQPGITFIFDRVMHYHRATLQEIEKRLSVLGIPFFVLSALDKGGAVGRVAETNRVVKNHEHFELSEKRIGGFLVRFQHDVLRKLKQTNPAVVVSTSHSGAITEWQVLRWAGRAGVRRVAWQCGYEYNPGLIKKFTLSRFIPLFDFHLCYHTNAKKYALQYGANQRQTLVMHNTIDERSIVASDKMEARTLLEAKHLQLSGKKIILYVGAVLEEKRLEIVFEALDVLNMPNALFLVVGDGPHLRILKEKYSQRQDWLSTGSIVNGVGTYFDAADVFVLPGTGGLAINEAMAHRLPVISGYADGSADDLVVDGENGYRLKEGSSDEFALRLADIMNNPNRAEAMGRHGEHMIRGSLSFNAFVDRVVGALEAQYIAATSTPR